MKKVGLMAALAVVLLSLFAFSEAFSAGTFTAFGPKDYTHKVRRDTTATDNFSVLNPNTSYTLHIYNGGKNNQFKKKVERGAISLNGVEVVRHNELRKRVSHIQKPIKLLKDNRLAVQIFGEPNTGITIEIIGVDNDPPKIAATLAPSPNAAGWNNTNVTVSFQCSDTTTPIASCSAPVLVQQEGANQVITGTATDIAGNTASASVTVNLDKTSPVVTILSPSSGATIEDSPVTVQGSIDEALSGVASITCKGTPATLSGSSFTCNVSLVTGQNTIQTAATDMAGNTGSSSITVAYLGPKYLAIVDVMVTDHGNFDNVPSDYTGLAYDETCTNPYIPGVIGQRVWSNDVNEGIGGTTTTVWVKYDFVPVGSNRPVLVDYGAFHWPYWNVDCPSGWQTANGTSASIQGALTTQTEGDCYRIGLCVHYLPMNQTDTFITNVGLSKTGGSEGNCPAWGEANEGYWPMQADVQDIHQGCGGRFWYLCYGRGKAQPPMPTSINATDEEKLNFLATYAPRVWIAQNESYWPSSVDWAFPHLIRTPCFGDPSTIMACGGGISPEDTTSYWLFTRESLDSPSDVLDFFHGCNGYSTSNPCTISYAPVYAFWVKKSPQVDGNSFDFVDLIYFFYYPYNRGKEVVDTIWGNHVSDWEHITVRLMWTYDDQTGWSIKPVQIYLSIHDFGYIYEWDDEAIPKINNTHPIIYSAWGSHGVWPTAGSHQYGSAMGTALVDDCSEGTAWDTWNYLAALDYNLQQGLGGSIWPLWMSDDFANPGNCGDRSNPACGPIYRWGNMEDGCTTIPFDGTYCRLENGPTGPVSKGVWGPGNLK